MEFCDACGAQARVAAAETDEKRVTLHYICANRTCTQYRKEIGEKTLRREQDGYACEKAFSKREPALK